MPKRKAHNTCFGLEPGMYQNDVEPALGPVEITPAVYFLPPNVTVSLLMPQAFMHGASAKASDTATADATASRSTLAIDFARRDALIADINAGFFPQSGVRSQLLDVSGLNFPATAIGAGP